MPKGVEHKDVEARLERHARVQLSVMPKGVEHTGHRPIAVGDAGATISDAERR